MTCKVIGMDVSYLTILNLFYFVSLSFLTAVAQEPYYGLCANPECSEPIGRGIAILHYSPIEHGRLKLSPKLEFDIFVKDYGEKKSLLGVMIDGEKGYVPNNMVQELRSFVRNLVFARSEFIHNQVGNPNQVTSQVHFSVTHQEVIHHSSPDAYVQEQNFHLNPQSSNYHSGGSWSGQNPENYASPHVHVLTSHVHATLDSSQVFQEPSTSTSQTQYTNYNSNPSSFVPNVQQTTPQQVADEQPYFQTQYANEYQSSQFSSNLETSFSPQMQSNSYFQSSYGHEVHTNNPYNQEQSHNSYPLTNDGSSVIPVQMQHSSEAFVSTQYSNQYGQVPSWDQSTSYSSENSKPQADWSGTFADLKARGYDETDFTGSSSSASANINPSQRQYSEQGMQGMNYAFGDQFASQPGYSSGANDVDYSAVSSEPVSSEETQTGFTTSTSAIEFFNGGQFQEPLTSREVPEETSKGTAANFQNVQNEVKEADALNEKDPNYEKYSNYEKYPNYEKDPTHEKNPNNERDTTHEKNPNNERDATHEKNLKYEKDPTHEKNPNNERDATHEKNLNYEKETSISDGTVSTVYSSRQDSTHSVFPQQVQSSNAQGLVAQTTPYSSDDSGISSANRILSSETVVTSDKTEIPQNTAYHEPSVNKLKEDSLKTNTLRDEANINNHFTSDDIMKTLDVSDITIDNSINLVPDNTVVAGDIVETDNTSSTAAFDVADGEHAKTGVFSFDSADSVFSRESVNETDILLDKEQKANLDQILNISETGKTETSDYLNAYQIRNLKGEQDNVESQNLDSHDEVRENVTYPEFDLYVSLENGLEAIRSFIDVLLSWVPEPLYSVLMELESKGISPRVPVFTALSAVACLFLIIAVVYIKERSKEKHLIGELAFSEKNVYSLSAEKNVLEERLEKVEAELESSKVALSSEQKFYEELKKEVVSLNQNLEKTNLELESSQEEIDSLKKREKEFVELIADHERAHLELVEEKNQLNNQLSSQEETISQFKNEIQEKDNELKALQEEKSQYLKANAVYEEKLTQIQQNCNQLLKEAEIWNLRVNELNTKLSEESRVKLELEESLQVKDGEIESLNFLVKSFKSFEELEDGDEVKREKIQCLMNSASISINLENQKEENKMILEKLAEERSKILDMEVEVLEAKSEIDKLKLNYNRALQDKTEAQTKLDVLTNYFKDKEIQLQKQLGAQEVFRERREKDADSAERRIILIDQENTSYKSQVASMKQEMEETERNLKSQIATQEKKAHENWIAARAAERKLEDMKQEVTQLRQKMTLLEREQGGFINSSRDDIIRPIPQRIGGINDETITSQDINNSIDEQHSMYRVPLPPMIHPDMPRDRPLPPLPPLPFEPPPMFPPPLFSHFPPPREPMFSSEFRVTPPEFARGRASTPPRGRQSAHNDSEMGPRQSSPLGGEMRESRNSTPPHSLPDFHDIPPPPRPFYPPSRFPFRPPFRREFAQGPRPDYQGDNSSGRGTQPASVPQEHWPPANSRV